MKNLASARTCVEALTEFAPEGVLTVPHALSYICHVNLPVNGKVQWQTQVSSDEFLKYIFVYLWRFHGP